MIGNVLDARLHKRMVSLTKGSERLSVLDFLVVTVACQEQDRQEDRVREAMIRELERLPSGRGSSMTQFEHQAGTQRTHGRRSVDQAGPPRSTAKNASGVTGST